MELQPLLHDLLTAVAAPTQGWSAPDGQIRPTGAQGVYHGDVRVLSCAVLTVGGDEPEVVAAGPGRGPGSGSVAETVAVLRPLDAPGADPTLRLRRTRTARPGAVTEVLELTAATATVVEVPLELVLACDLAPMEGVKRGSAFAGRTVLATARDEASLSWAGDGVTVSSVDVVADGAVVDLNDPTRPVLRWHTRVEPGRATVVRWDLRVGAAPGAVVGGAPERPTWSTPVVDSDDRRLPALLDRALGDLAALRMTSTTTPDDVFLAAGAPWFLTLFGRDSLWAARMLLPLGTELAGGTLRTLAARQGRTVDAETAEQPGKILHEVRSTPLALGDDGTGERVLPPVYYGTVDATPLWVTLLHDAWRWGLPDDEVAELLPAMEAALAWMSDHGDADGDGFLEYADAGGHGLANQGWKDSGDSVQWRDGRLAEGPIALCEVQGYAYEAARAGADLLDAFGRPGADRWRRWADELADRFRAQFWVADGVGRYPAIALDATKRPVDSLTSNIGHLLGTGILTADEEALVADRLGRPDLDSGYGLRTLSSTSGGYWPLRYHGGSVWTHDTAITILGLARSGHTTVAASLVEGLLAAAADVGYRLPELHSGDTRGTSPTVVPYPAACRPQAWSAASAVGLLTAVLGLSPDRERGSVTVRPMQPSPVGALRVGGLRVGRRDVAVAVDAAGTALPVTPTAGGEGLVTPGDA